ncbi:MAG: hypothetical protein IJS39_06200 [Synergistaceae bacterium]|nr:hypothetical protein [Synergistaceae bacterium]
MAATTTVTKIAVNLKLNNGVGADGNIRTVPVSMGKINRGAFDADKALAISSLIGQCLTKQVYYLEKVEYSAIESD